MSPFITLLTAIKKLLAFKVDRDEFRDVIRDTKKDIEGIKNDIEDTKREIKDIVEEVEGNIAQSDWNQNDESAPDYVKNRPFYTYIAELSTDEITGDYESDGINRIEYDTTKISPYWNDGQPVIVTWNGVEYPLTIRYDIYGSMPGVGNFSLYYPGAENTGEPFVIYISSKDRFQVCVSESQTATWKITIPGVTEVVDVPIPEKYLPEGIMESIAAAQTAASNAQATAETAQTTSDSKMDKVNSVGTGSFSMNRQSNSFVGDNSFTAGVGTIANHMGEQAIGRFNAYTENSKTEGGFEDFSQKIRSSGYVYYSESYSYDSSTSTFTLIEPALVQWISVPTNVYCIIDSTSTSVQGGRSGSNLVYVETNKNYSASYRTIIGKKRILIDTASEYGNYACVVGNGTSDSERSNAHTLDWEGNAWYQGEVYVGGTSQKDGERLLKASDLPDIKGSVGTHSMIQNDIESNYAYGDYSSAEGIGSVSSRKGEHIEGSYNIYETPIDTYVEKQASEAHNLTILPSNSVWVSKSYTFDETTGLFTLYSPTTDLIQDLNFSDYFVFHRTGTSTDYSNCGQIFKFENFFSNLTSNNVQAYVITALHNSKVRGKYAHIVGNGTSDDNRSNAHTLDWDGNAWYAGTLRVGGTSYDDAKEVALKEDIPQGGSGGSPMRIIANLTLSEDVDKVIIDSDLDGNPLSLERAVIVTKTRNYNDVSEKFTFCLNDGWSTTDPYVSAVNVSAKSSEDWTRANHFVIETGHSNNGDGMALVYQPLSNLTSSGVVNSAYKSTHAEIRSLVFHGKFAAGCSFYVMGKDKV